MKHLCAWCKRHLPEDDEEPRDEVSHSICQECEEKALANINEYIREQELRKKK